MTKHRIKGKFTFILKIQDAVYPYSLRYNYLASLGAPIISLKISYNPGIEEIDYLQVITFTHHKLVFSIM